MVTVAALSASTAGAVSASADRTVALGGGVVSGTVTSAATGAPLAGVCVEADGNGRPGGTVTAADGSWTLTDLAAGPLFLAVNDCEAAVAGYAATWWPGVASPDASHAVLIEPGTVHDHLDLALATAAVVVGRVLGPEGAGVAAACVLARGPDEAVLGRTRTSADGGYRLASLPPGTVEVEARDCSPSPTRVAASTTVTATAGRATSAATVTLGAGGAVTGRVRATHTGQPVAGACVTLWTAEPTLGASLFRGSTTSGADPLGASADEPGRYVFDGVAPGRYRVFFGFDLCSPEDGYGEEWFDDRQGPAIYEPDATTEVVEVTAGVVVSGIDAELDAVATVLPTCPYPPVTGYPDVDAESGHGPGIACTWAFGILAPRSDGTFAPTSTVTRGEVATALTRAIAVVASDVLSPAPPDAFDDDAGAPDEVALDQLAWLGVLRGTGPRQADPDQLVTRGQLATLLAGAFRVATGTPLVAAAPRWTDGAGLHGPALDAVSAAGLLAGVTPTEVHPDDPVRRDQLATVLARFVARVVTSTAPAADPPA